jgi:hypothetical protein
MKRINHEERGVSDAGFGMDFVNRPAGRCATDFWKDGSNG